MPRTAKVKPAKFEVRRYATDGQLLETHYSGDGQREAKRMVKEYGGNDVMIAVSIVPLASSQK